MRVLPPLLALLVLSVIVAGCVSDPGPASVAPVVVDASPHIVPAGLDVPAIVPDVQQTQVSNGAEPVILAKADGSALLVADTTGIKRSTDGGQSWLHTSYLLLNVVLADGWAMAEDDVGNLYAAALAEGRLHVARSLSGGQSWDLTSHLPDTLGAIPDRPWVSAQNDGEVALIYNDSGLVTRCMKSYDGGVTFPDVRPAGGAPIAGGTAFGDDGTLFYTGDLGQIYISAPPPPLGGVVERQCQQGAVAYRLWPHDLGQTGQVQVATGDGGAYISVPTADNGQIVVAGSTTFTGAPRTVVVSPSNLGSNTFSTIAMKDGRIAVSWLGSTTPGDPNNVGFSGSWKVYVATIDDFWGTPDVTVYEVTPTPMHVGNICMNGLGCTGSQDRDLLDYMGVDIGADGRLHMVWTDDTQSPVRVMHAALTPS